MRNALLTLAYRIVCFKLSPSDSLVRSQSELQFFAQHGEQAQQVTAPGFVSIFRACNLQAAVSLLEELDQSPKSDTGDPCPVFPGEKMHTFTFRTP